MNWSKWIRQVHRWMSMAFALGFIVNLFALGGPQPPALWVYLAVLIPLFVLFPTGMFMFFRPYFARRRGAPSPTAS